MDINIVKSGKFAFTGVNIEHVAKGHFENYNNFKAMELISAGWADRVSDYVPEDDEQETEEVPREYTVEEIKETGNGWMSVKLKGHDIVKIRAKDDDEALEKAIKKIES